MATARTLGLARALGFLAMALPIVWSSEAVSAEYANPKLLIEPHELSQALETGADVVVLDVRSEQAARDGRVQGARRIDINAWKAAFGDGTDAKGWSERITEAGIGPKSTVVVYDSAVSPSAARAWWLLKYWGVENARVLNGGFPAWKAAEGPTAVSAPEPAQRPTKPFVAKAHPERHATTQEVLAAAGAGEACLVDTRTTREVVAGVIPSSRHLDWADLVNPESGKMRSADELKPLLDGVGFQAKAPAVTYCRSGGRASVMALAMELMGGEKVANYFGSWSAWTRTPGAPIQRPGADPVGE